MKKKEIIEGVTKEISKEVYTDLIQPVAKNVGSGLEIITSFFNNIALSPLKKFNIKYEQKIIAFQRQMEEKYNNISIENRVDPELHIVYPTMDALKYNILNDEVANMFCNLLVSDLDSKTQKNCSPAFIKIIEQLRPFDAIIYKTIVELLKSEDKLPICNIEFTLETDKTKKLNKNPLPKNIVDVDLFKCDEYELSTSIEALVRLGLLTVTYEKWISNNQVYEKLKNQKFVNVKLDEENSKDILKFESTVVLKGILYLSEFSLEFARVCLRDLEI